MCLQPGIKACLLCKARGDRCTFVEEPSSRKRRRTSAADAESDVDGAQGREDAEEPAQAISDNLPDTLAGSCEGSQSLATWTDRSSAASVPDLERTIDALATEAHQSEVRNERGPKTMTLNLYDGMTVTYSGPSELCGFEEDLETPLSPPLLVQSPKGCAGPSGIVSVDSPITIRPNRPPGGDVDADASNKQRHEGQPRRSLLPANDDQRKACELDDHIGSNSADRPCFKVVHERDVGWAGPDQMDGVSVSRGGATAVVPSSQGATSRKSFPDRWTSFPKLFEEFDGVGAALIDLYFCHVHPTYPICSQDRIKSKTMARFSELSAPSCVPNEEERLPRPDGGKSQRMHSEESKSFASMPLVASMLLAASRWWKLSYDHRPPRRPVLDASHAVIGFTDDHDLPDMHYLERYVQDACASDLAMPRLVTIQCMLLHHQASLHRHRRNDLMLWAASGSMVSTSQNLGLHVSSQSWNIDVWEKRLRKRLWWAVYMADKWLAFGLGRPSHIANDQFTVETLTLGDCLEESDEVALGKKRTSKPRTMEGHAGESPLWSPKLRGFSVFIKTSQLTVILSDVLATLFSDRAVQALRGRKEGTLRLARPLLQRLEHWETAGDHSLEKQLKDLHEKAVRSAGDARRVGDRSREMNDGTKGRGATSAVEQGAAHLHDAIRETSQDQTFDAGGCVRLAFFSIKVTILRAMMRCDTGEDGGGRGKDPPESAPSRHVGPDNDAPVDFIFEPRHRNGSACGNDGAEKHSSDGRELLSVSQVRGEAIQTMESIARWAQKMDVRQLLALWLSHFRYAWTTVSHFALSLSISAVDEAEFDHIETLLRSLRWSLRLHWRCTDDDATRNLLDPALQVLDRFCRGDGRQLRSIWRRRTELLRQRSLREGQRQQDESILPSDRTAPDVQEIASQPRLNPPVGSAQQSEAGCSTLQPRLGLSSVSRPSLPMQAHVGTASGLVASPASSPSFPSALLGIQSGDVAELLPMDVALSPPRPSKVSHHDRSGEHGLHQASPWDGLVRLDSSGRLGDASGYADLRGDFDDGSLDPFGWPDDVSSLLELLCDDQVMGGTHTGHFQPDLASMGL